jgi:Trk-type K+ transport system membrane component
LWSDNRRTWLNLASVNMSISAVEKPFRARRVIKLVGTRILPSPKRFPISLQLVTGLFILILTGTGLLLLPGMTYHPISFFTALFTSTSAATVTGLNIVTTVNTFTFIGQIVILFLIQAELD